MGEKVLVFRNELLVSLGSFQGYTLNITKYLSAILHPSNNEFKDRSDVEYDPVYKQIISYVVLRYKDSIFSYVRGKGIGESRLVGKRALGLGGHVEQGDSKLSSTNHELYVAASRREVWEEIKIESLFYERIVALLNDDFNDVGRVHFGILHIWDLVQPSIVVREKDILEAHFITLADIAKIYCQLEPWSQIVFDILIKESRVPPYMATGNERLDRP
ncbi:MAG: hypothetical protein AABZ15_05585 [Nitrospirota bacterium]